MGHLYWYWYHWKHDGNKFKALWYYDSQSVQLVVSRYLFLCLHAKIRGHVFNIRNRLNTDWLYCPAGGFLTSWLLWILPQQPKAFTPLTNKPSACHLWLLKYVFLLCYHLIRPVAVSRVGVEVVQVVKPTEKLPVTISELYNFQIHWRHLMMYNNLNKNHQQ